MEEIWIIGLGQFGYIAFQRLSETINDRHFVLVDPVEENLLRCKGPTATLRIVEQALGLILVSTACRCHGVITGIERL